MSTPLGSGQFGMVSQGVWSSPSGPVNVAVKTLKPRSSETDKVKFLQEAAINGQFRHPNVVKLIGVVTSDQPVRKGFNTQILYYLGYPICDAKHLAFFFPVFDHKNFQNYSLSLNSLTKISYFEQLKLLCIIILQLATGVVIIVLDTFLYVQVMIVLELMSNGDLRNHLVKLKQR